MKTFNAYLGIFLSALLIAGCSDSSPVDTGGDGNQTDGSSSKYIVAASPNALEDVADYLLVTDSLSGGSVSTLDNGIEQDGTYRYYVTSNDNSKFFSFLYSNSGTVTTYQLNGAGELEEVADFQSSIVHAFTAVNDDILSMRIPRDGEPNARWYRLDTKSIQFVDEGRINTEKLAGNGEWAYFTWLTQVGDKIFAPYASIKACCNDTFGTQYPDSAWIAVFNYPSMELDTVITDNRTGYIGSYYNNGLSVDEKGDAYAFSNSLADNNGAFTSTRPSAITRIKRGEKKFDQNYFFNIEEASNGWFLTHHIYAGDGNVVLLMADQKESPYQNGERLAVANVYSKSFEWVTGVPDTSTVTAITERNNFVSEDGSRVSVGITTDQSSYVYNIDIATATAKRGLEVEGGTITAIHRLESSE